MPARARAVLDSNLLIRGLLRRQRRAAAVALLDAVMEGRLRLVTSEYLLAEVDRTLREPEVRALRSLSETQIDALVTVLLKASAAAQGLRGSRFGSRRAVRPGSGHHGRDRAGPMAASRAARRPTSVEPLGVPGDA